MGGFAAATTCEGSQRVGIVRASDIAARKLWQRTVLRDKEITAHELYKGRKHRRNERRWETHTLMNTVRVEN